MAGSDEELMIQNVWISIITVVVNDFLSLVVISMQIPIQEEREISADS